jgi:head-tail adaptor
MMPAHLMIQSAVVEKPTAATDSRGDATDGWDSPTRVTITAWIDQQSTAETDDETRNSVTSTALLVTNYANLAADDRVVWDDKTWTVQGRPRQVPTLVGTHHVEATLRLVEG